MADENETSGVLGEPGGAAGQLTASRAADVVLEGLSSGLPAGLYIVATPIGNLADITLRALNVLARCDVIACEDTRHSRKLLSHYSIDAKLVAYHEHNASSMRRRLIRDIQDGKSVALISDAGTPLISDPGYKLVEDIRDLGLMVTALPGPCAPIMALTLSVLPTDRFFFEGFLPSKQGQRVKRLQVLADTPASLVFFETAKRIGDSLTDMATVFGARPVAVCKELTKRFEAVSTGLLPEVSRQFLGDDVKGEFVVVLGPPVEKEIGDEDIIAALRASLSDNSLRDSVKEVCEALNVSKSRVYNLGLKIKDGQEGEP